MSDEQIFIDTNLLVYAHDAKAGSKHRIAKQRVKSLWERDFPPAVSVQVLQEAYVNFTRKGMAANEARKFVADYLQWDVIVNDTALLLDGLGLSQRWRVSLWDALILAAAKRAKASIIWSEDLNAGQDYGGVVVVNPFVIL
jgi:predicted nucleic acid-binding protein